ncbi:hypothetical protein HHK36_006446 [Tetracentron sinense]|uniref:Nucleolar protein 12 n=1 Tax=Tetracentron sinense TaxID=13715 RepID=A0A834ZHJ2_TETSI|nr:hypothetical protein HHK36_006446 [Tetracentron sinense]
MEEEEAVSQVQRANARHIKKRSLKNKALSVTFKEKDLSKGFNLTRDYVTGFHKRKKKRRKEAQHQLQEVQRVKRIENRRKRKLEREFVQYGGAQPATSSGPDESVDDLELEGGDLTASISVEGTKIYDNGGMKITVMTSEISREEEESSRENSLKTQLVPRLSGTEKKLNIPVTKKPFKKVGKSRPTPKPQKKRDKKKGKKKNKKKMN